NGLPTERRVQNKFGITCNPHLAYDSSWKPQDSTDPKQRTEVSRPNFIEACALVTEEDEAAFEALWRRLGLSVEWQQQYATIDERCRHISQLSFLDLVQRGHLYNAESPTMWDVGFQTALAQADLEDREKQGAFHDIRFGVEGGGEFVIATTRPELLPACIAVVAHPSDERYKKFFGKNAITPLFEAVVPIVASEHADPEKGSGIMMICTFGDAADVEWWKASGLPIRQIIGKDGRLMPVTFGEAPFLSQDPKRAAAAYAELVGKSAKQAKTRVAEMLAEEGSAVGGDGCALVGEPKPTMQMVKFYEKGEQPIEFITTRQWFIKVLDYKTQLLEQGAKIEWHPAHMRSRYDHWVEGLAHDWCISRQRFFGVPFPVWYPVNDDGAVNYASPIYAEPEALPIDPLADVPPGFSADQRGKPGGFVGDPDVMDTWATSSLTPQIVSKWGLDNARHQKLFPMDMRPQSHEIIRTWAFYTIVKAWMHEEQIPWKHVVISGWILDPDRKKMSKSRGNVVTPQHLLDEYSSDAVRYWAGRARLGVDTAFDDKVFKTGRKLATKIFNASRFVLMQIADTDPSERSVAAITDPLDKAYVENLRGVIAQATQAFDRFDYAAALQAAESAFWFYCDNFIELVKSRAYQTEDKAGKLSAVSALEWSLGVFLRLLAPVMPYITDEVWSWHFAAGDKESIHTAKWPSVDEVSTVAKGDGTLVDCCVEILDKIRQEKSDAQVSLKTPVTSLEISASDENLALLKLGIDDVLRTGRVDEQGLKFSSSQPADGKRFEVKVELGTLE
ncbi:MAG: valine--tRNA ligase, partial [Bdellovibrionales bacterium]|nr:valine--tRNA ligase [Bdellovibrionales bacterium]